MPKQIELKPIKESTEDYERLEKAIKDLFRRQIYLPILKDLEQPPATLTNALGTPLTDALQSGRVTYYRGTFSGKFNSSISSELRSLGARWDRKEATWKLPLSELPMDIRNAISASSARFAQTIQRIDARLRSIVPEEVAGQLQSAKFFDASLWRVDKEFQETLKKITVAPQLSDSARQRIADEWQDNMKIWIKDFTQAEVQSLRKEMQKSVFSGNRYGSAVKSIQESYGVSERKAKFLARQETALLMAKFKETRYSDAGVNKYTWRCVAGSKNHPVRPWHKDLEGKTFQWDNPPVTTKPGEPQRRNNPGQDYNCRCFARPIVEFRTKKGT